MQICALPTRIQCKVSDTQVTVKACGPLVFISNIELIKQKLFSLPELKAQVSFSDHLSSVVCPSVCKLFTFSSPEPMGQFQPNLAQSIPG